MYIYDNTGIRKKVNSPTFSINVDGVDILYTYIRKNACTSFKRLFKTYSSYNFHDSGGDLKGMAHNHLVKWAEEADKVSSKIFIYRDPLERVVSVFKNKFIQESGAVDITKDFLNVTGKNVEECTFYDFIFLYVSKIKAEGNIDAHLLPQVWHLMPIEYNCAIPLEKVEIGMSEIIGREVAKTHFSKPVNSTSQNVSVDIEDASNLTVNELRKIYQCEAIYPSLSSLVDADMEELLHSIYKDDYSMLSRLRCR